MTRRIFPLLALSVLMSLPAASEDDPRRDGNWWQGIGASQKLSYVVGFFDGMQLGHLFSYWGTADKAGKTDATLAVGVIGSFSKMNDQYFKNVTNGQITEGLDKFYADYRNRSIAVYNAVWIVANMISGKSDAEMQTMVESYRKNAR